VRVASQAPHSMVSSRVFLPIGPRRGFIGGPFSRGPLVRALVSDLGPQLRRTHSAVMRPRHRGFMIVPAGHIRSLLKRLRWKWPAPFVEIIHAYLRFAAPALLACAAHFCERKIQIEPPLASRLREKPVILGWAEGWQMRETYVDRVDREGGAPSCVLISSNTHICGPSWLMT